MKGAAEKTAAARSHERFRITSYLQLSRGRRVVRLPRGARPQLSFFFYAKKFFRDATPQMVPRSTTAATGSTRMRWRRANILAPGFRELVNPHPLSRLHR